MKIALHTPELINIHGWGGTYVIEHRRDALIELGHEVIMVPTHVGTEGAIERLFAFGPDLLITQPSMLFVTDYEKILKYREESGMKIALELGHEPLVRSKLKVSLPEVDLLYSHFKQSGYKNTKFLPLACNPKYHKKPDKIDIKYKVSYVGSFHTGRIIDSKVLFNLSISRFNLSFTIDKMKKNNIDIRKLEKLVKVNLIGPGWGKDDRHVPKEQLHRIYASSLVCPNYHTETMVRMEGLNERTFQVPACFGFEVCDYIPIIRDFFSQKELVVAKDAKEWYELVLYYVDNPEERMEYIIHGYERAHRDHTYVLRMKQLMNWI